MHAPRWEYRRRNHGSVLTIDATVLCSSSESSIVKASHTPNLGMESDTACMPSACCYLRPSANCVCLVFIVVAGWAIVVQLGTSLVKATNQKTYTIGSLPGPLRADLGFVCKISDQPAYWQC